MEPSPPRDHPGEAADINRTAPATPRSELAASVLSPVSIIQMGLNGRTGRTDSITSSILVDDDEFFRREIRTSTPDLHIDIRCSVFDLRNSDAAGAISRIVNLRLQKNQRLIRSKSFEKQFRSQLQVCAVDELILIDGHLFHKIDDKAVSFPPEQTVDNLRMKYCYGRNEFYAILLNPNLSAALKEETGKLIRLIHASNGSTALLFCHANSTVQDLLNERNQFCTKQEQEEACLASIPSNTNTFIKLLPNMKLNEVVKEKYPEFYIVKATESKVKLNYRRKPDQLITFEMKCKNTSTMKEIQDCFVKNYQSDGDCLFPKLQNSNGLMMAFLSTTTVSDNEMILCDGVVRGKAFNSYFEFGNLETDYELPEVYEHLIVGSKKNTFDIDISSRNSIRITVSLKNFPPESVSPRKSKFSLLLDKNQNVSALKVKIMNHTRVPVTGQKLVYDSRVLMDDETLCSQVENTGESITVVVELLQRVTVTTEICDGDQRLTKNFTVYPGLMLNQFIIEIATIMNCSFWKIKLYYLNHVFDITTCGHKTLSNVLVPDDTRMEIVIDRQLIRVQIIPSFRADNIASRCKLFIFSRKYSVDELKEFLAVYYNDYHLNSSYINLIYNGCCLEDKMNLEDIGVCDLGRIWMSVQENACQAQIFECEEHGDIHKMAGIVIGGFILKGSAGSNLTPELLQSLLEADKSKKTNSPKSNRESDRNSTLCYNAQQHGTQRKASTSLFTMNHDKQPQHNSTPVTWRRSQTSHSTGEENNVSAELHSHSQSLPILSHGHTDTSMGATSASVRHDNGTVTTTMTTSGQTVMTQAKPHMTGSKSDSETGTKVIAMSSSLTSLIKNKDKYTLETSNRKSWSFSDGEMSMSDLSLNGGHRAKFHLESDSLQSGFRELGFDYAGVVEDETGASSRCADVVKQYQPPENCVGDKILHCISKKLGNEGVSLGRSLGIEEPTIDKIKHANSNNMEELNYQILRKWKDIHGHNATKDKLKESLMQVEKFNIVHCYFNNESASESEN